MLRKSCFRPSFGRLRLPRARILESFLGFDCAVVGGCARVGWLAAVFCKTRMVLCVCVRMLENLMVERVVNHKNSMIVFGYRFYVGCCVIIDLRNVYQYVFIDNYCLFKNNLQTCIFYIIFAFFVNIVNIKQRYNGCNYKATLYFFS